MMVSKDDFSGVWRLFGSFFAFEHWKLNNVKDAVNQKTEFRNVGYE